MVEAREGFDPDELPPWESGPRHLFPLNPLFPQCNHLEWPTIDGAAFYGLPGQVVHALEEHTEADPVAILVSYLTFFGAVVGRAPHASADGAEHPGRLFVVIVGETSKARKGTSYVQVRRVYLAADRRFTEDRVLGGFGSGEAMVDAVSGEDDDHRLLVIEPEWARVLSVGRRDGSTLSPLLRQAWDGDRLAVRSRSGGTVVASDAHIGVLGHVTVEELRAKLTDVEVANGYANRHLFVLAKRSKLLPSGGNLDDEVVARLASSTASCLKRARSVGILRRSPDAETRWAELYHEMAADDASGLLGAVIARDAAQVLRLSVVYALTDASHSIEVPHIEAAWAVWRYCRHSAAYIFGTATGNPIADKLLAAITEAGPDGLDSRAMDRRLAGHASAAEREAALDYLNRRGQIALFTQPTRGRLRRGAIARMYAEEEDKAEKDSVPV